MASRRIETPEWKAEHQAKAAAVQADRRDAEIRLINAYIATVRHKPEHQRADRARVVTIAGTVLFEGAADKAYELAAVWNRGEKLLFVENLR